MARYFVIFDTRDPVMVSQESFDTLADADAYVEQYNLSNRQGGYEIYRGERLR